MMNMIQKITNLKLNDKKIDLEILDILNNEMVQENLSNINDTEFNKVLENIWEQ